MNIKGISLGAVAVLSASALFSTGVALAADTNGQDGTSEATFSIAPNNDDDAELSLTSVPDFDFGEIKSTNIYHGFTGIAAQGTLNPVTVEDNRMANSGWSLQVSREAFLGLTGSVLHLASGSSEIGNTQLSGNIGEVDDETQPTTIGANQGTGFHGTFEMAMAAADNTLDLAANPKADIAAGSLTSDLTWTLSGDDLTGGALR